jgi:hypothetical protein
MNKKIYLSIMSLATILLILPIFVKAQEEPPRNPPDPENMNNYIGTEEDNLVGIPGHKFPASSMDQNSLASPASENTISLGQPGFSFSYAQRFGETTVGYFEDDNHFSQVTGIATDGDNLWIGDYFGNRALKFNSSGNKIQQIGKASFRDYYDKTSLSQISDIGIDSAHNTWIVDQGAHHIAIFDSSGTWIGELGEAWESGSDTNHFRNPKSIAFDSSNNIYVSDYGNDRIQVFDSNKAYKTTISVNTPTRIAVFGTALYIPSENDCKIYVYNIADLSSISLTNTLGSSCGSSNSQFNEPNGVAVNSNYLFIADSANHRVVVYNRNTLNYATKFGSNGSGNGQFNYPTDIAIDSSGNIFVADYWNYRVQKFNSVYVYQGMFGTTGVPYLTDDYHYNYPTGVAVSSDRSIYIVEERGHRLVKLNSNGIPQWTVGIPGTRGSGNDRFRFPNGVAVGPSGKVYVADSVNDRVQIFNSNGSYFNTIPGLQGPQGIAIGADERIYIANSDANNILIYNSSLNLINTINIGFYANDIAIDSNNNLYVVDNERHVIFKCLPSSSSYNCSVFIGVLNDSTDDYGHLRYPVAVAVDKQGRVYVADRWGGRVQVFDANAAYLTTIGGSSGGNTGQLRQAEGLAVDANGALYVAEYLNHRIQKYIPGTPYWVQKNINGFGDRKRHISTLTSYGDYLYVGTYKTDGYGDHLAHLWRMDANGNWSIVVDNGFNKMYNVGIDHLIEFKGNLYAGIWSKKSDEPETEGGEIWRSSSGDNGTWTQVIDPGFGDIYNGRITRMGVFDDQLYAATWSYTTTHGVEIWRSPSGDYGTWSKVLENGLGDATNGTVLSFESFNGAFYASTYSWNDSTDSPAGAEIWRTTDGTIWSKVTDDCFNNAATCYEIGTLKEFNNYLYAGTSLYNPSTYTNPGGQIWRCAASTNCDEESDWQQLTLPSSLGNPNNYAMRTFRVFNNQLYVFASNQREGLQVWRTSDGANWQQIGFAGFGDSNNGYQYFDNPAAIFNNKLYFGTINNANGGEVWQFLDKWLFLPLIIR